jgi:hypothetical protein
MNFNSPELNNLETNKQPLGPHTPDPIVFDNLKDELKLFVYTKSRAYQKYMDYANLKVISDENGSVFLSKLVSTMEYAMTDGLSLDDPKRYQISNYFSIIKSSFKGLEKLTPSVHTEAICASIVGILTKNYL